MSAKPRTPSLRHHKPSGQAVVTLSGRDVYLGPYGSQEAEQRYQQAIAEWWARGRMAPAPKSEPQLGPTIAEMLVPFVAHCDQYYRREDGTPTGESDNIKLALRPLLEVYAHLPAKDFSQLQLKAVRQKLIDSGLTRSGVNRRVAYIVQAFRWAAEEKLVPASAWHDLKCVKSLKRGRSDARETEDVPPVPIDRVEATLPHMSRQVAAMVRLQLLSGARPGEICSMRACDIDMTRPVWVYRPAQHKEKWRGMPRSIYLNPEAQSIVKEFLKTELQAPLFSPAEAEAEHRAEKRRQRKTPLWPSHVKAQTRKKKAKPNRRPRDRYTNKTYHHAVMRACDRVFRHPALSEIPEKQLTENQKSELDEWRKANRWHPHQLRHTAGTEARLEHGLDFAQVFLGHARASTTEIYAKADQEKVISIMAKIG